MKKRIFSTLVLWALLFALLFTGGLFGCLALLLAASILTQLEYYFLLKTAGYKPITSWGVLLGSGILLGCAFTGLSIGEIAVLAIITTCTLACFKRSLAVIQYSLLPTLSGMMYIPFMLGFVIKFVQEFSEIAANQAVNTIFLLIAVSKFSDVGGLLIGCRFGRHKFIPTISPNKTLEGVLGGILASIIVGILGVVFLKHHLLPGLTIANITVLSTILAIIALLGDITESAIKRIAGVKDSGRIIPGIGGIFDLTDSLIPSLPLGVILLEHFVL